MTRAHAIKFSLRLYQDVLFVRLGWRSLVANEAASSITVASFSSFGQAIGEHIELRVPENAQYNMILTTRLCG